MTIEFATSIVIGAFTLYLIWNLVKNPNTFYLFLILTSICFTPIIVGGNYPIADEIIFTIAGLVGTVIILWRSKKLKLRSLESENYLKLFALSYFLINTTISLIDEFSFSKIRFLNLFISSLLILFVLQSQNGKNPNSLKVAKIAFHINLYLWLIYYIAHRLLGIDWNNQQAVTYVGSSYAALIPAAGLIILLIAEAHEKSKKLSVSFYIYFAGSVIASQIYYSRILELCVIILIALVIAIKRSPQAALGILLAFSAAFILSGKIVDANYGHVSTLKVTNPTILDLGEEITTSIKFVSNPRPGDADRGQQIRCSTRLVAKNKDLKIVLFGFGQNNHKVALRSCTEELVGPIPADKLIRPVGYAALVTDFGIVGIVLILSLIFQVAVKMRREKYFLLYLILIAEISMFSFITNNLDHEFLYMILFFNFLSSISFNLKNRE